MPRMAEPGVMSPASESATAPESTATLLFTDVEGSTQRWERHTAAMASAYRGYLVVRRHSDQEEFDLAVPLLERRPDDRTKSDDDVANIIEAADGLRGAEPYVAGDACVTSPSVSYVRPFQAPPRRRACAIAESTVMAM
jgi:hypothetical protein